MDAMYISMNYRRVLREPQFVFVDWWSKIDLANMGKIGK